MCGIAGYIGYQSIEDATIAATMQRMQRRGPDAQSYRKIQDGNTHIILIHSRLSILDLDPRSNQPFEREQVITVYNGEIYNYQELKQEAIQCGDVFKTTSDTEVFLSRYLRYGEACVDAFEGMWSFALYDQKLKKLMLSRDRFGEKPLYILRTEHGLFFGSEIKFLSSLSGQKLTVNEQHLKRYLVNGHKSLYKKKEHFFKEIEELDIAHNMIVDHNLNIHLYKYWSPKVLVNKLSLADIIESTREKLIHSVKLRLRSDVPLAFCLSGGVDSASLVSIAAKVFNADIQSFSIIDSDAHYNEFENIQATIDDTGCKNTKIHISPNENNIERLIDLVDYHDGPVATISYLVHAMLSEAIQKNGYKISISGTAADELFTGYYDHFVLHLYEMREHARFQEFKGDWEKYVLEFVRHPEFRKHNLYFDNPDLREHIYLNNRDFSTYLKDDFAEAFTETKYTSSLLKNRMMNELFHEVVRIILHEDDLNSMRYSIENRSPFLDTDLVNFAYSIPNEHLIQKGYAKYILRESMKGILNDTVRLSREKKGFNASIHSLIDFNNPQHRDFLLSDSPVYELVDRKKIEKAMAMKEIPNSYKKFLFNFINTKIFLENNQL